MFQAGVDRTGKRTTDLTRGWMGPIANLAPTSTKPQKYKSKLALEMEGLSEEPPGETDRALGS